MDYRGNMSGQHRRSKINHSIIKGPELTNHQSNLLKNKKKFADLTIQELTELIEICQLHIIYWKNRRNIRKKWEMSVELAKQELISRDSTKG